MLNEIANFLTVAKMSDIRTSPDILYLFTENFWDLGQNCSRIQLLLKILVIMAFVFFLVVVNFENHKRH